jgi:hypothetical protein
VLHVGISFGALEMVQMTCHGIDPQLCEEVQQTGAVGAAAKPDQNPTARRD